jgi:hypothetical protein
MTRRRPLAFHNLNEVMPEVDRLLLGYERAGNWSLGQVCQHLTRTLRHSVEGWPLRAPWLVRRTLGPLIGGRVLSRGQMAEGIKLDPKLGLTPGTHADDRAEAEALRGAIRYYQAWTEPLPEHPFFGPLSRSQWDRLHELHCAHHLSFLHPVAGTA